MYFILTLFCNFATFMGETDLFNLLFRQYYQPLLFFALQYITDEEECHDIVNGVFEETWRHIHQIDESTAKSFLYTSVRNRCIDYVRRMKLKQQYIEFTELMSERYIQADEQIEQKEIKQRIYEVLNASKPPTKEILEACYIQGKKYKEVAEEMKISIATVKKHMVRALKILRDLKNFKNVT